MPRPLETEEIVAMVIVAVCYAVIILAVPLIVLMIH
jgi:hypothetical protein